MSIVRIDCPYCGREQTAAKIVREVWGPNRGTEVVIQAIAQCQHCQFCSILPYARDERGFTADATPIQYEGDPVESGWRLLHAAPARHELPAHLPTAISHYFGQAVGSLKAGYWDATVEMCLKALDGALAQLDDPKGATISRRRRLARLIAAKGLGQTLEAWAVDLEHLDDPPRPAEMTAETARDLVDFTEILLTLAFSIPAAIAARRT